MVLSDAEHLVYLQASTTAPVTTRLANARGNITFQPHDMSWSNRGRGRDARSRMKKRNKEKRLEQKPDDRRKDRAEPAAEEEHC